MLYPSLNQPVVFCVMIAAGFFSAILLLFTECCTKKLKKHTVFSQILYFFSILICFFIFVITNLYINFGQFRLYTISTFVVSIVLFKHFFAFLWTKLRLKCYNHKRGREAKQKKEKA